MWVFYVQISLQDLDTPISFNLPTIPEARRVSTQLRSMTCPTDGKPRRLQMTCRYSGGLNASVEIACDGQTALAPYRCPAMPRCGFWNETSRAFSSQGCKTLGVTDSGRKLWCECTHLTTFTAISDSVERTTALELLSTLGNVDPQEGPRTSSGLLLVLGAIYGSMFLSLVLIRLRRVHQSFAFLK